MNDIVIDNDNELTIDVKPIVTVPGALVFVRNGQEIGRIDATYDFASINDDPEMVALAIQIVQASRQRIHLAL